MAIPTLITDLSTTAASNSPAGSDNVFPDLDNYIRAAYAFVAQLHAGTTKPSWSAATRIPFFDASGNYATASTFVRDASANYGLGTGSPSFRLDVNAAGSAVGQRLKTTTTGAYAVFQDNTTSGSGPYFGATGDILSMGYYGVAEYAQIDGSGNFIKKLTSTPPTLGTNGHLVVNATSNTNLRFSYRGSDGVTRTANLTLA